MMQFLAGAFVGGLVTLSAMVLCICADDNGREIEYEEENQKMKEQIEQLIEKYEKS